VSGIALCWFLASLPGSPTSFSSSFTFGSMLGTTYQRALLPIPVIVAIAPIIWLVFRKTWRDLDIEAQIHRTIMLERGEFDFRPAVMLVMAAIILTMQDYYGGRSVYDDLIRPWLMKYELSHENSRIKLMKYDELYSYAWWGFARIAGYVLIPFPIYKLIFRHDRLLDMGLRTRGFITHAWIYFLCLFIVLPALWLVSRQPDFGSYYPFYKGASRSYFDLLLWESIYFSQFLGLELFFRGLWLGALRRSLGSGAIFSMCVPYCMIHFGKPYLEANGAIIAGIVLGSLSMRTKSIYAGFLVHVTVALAMDLVALSHRNVLPRVFWPPG
jgi:membrane protease YdiL (CAAX protease family)